MRTPRKPHLLIACVLLAFGSARAAELASPHDQANGNFGLAVVSLPDVTGDGIADVLVGAFGEVSEGGAAEAGRVYIFDGATAGLLRELAPPTQRASDLFGYSVAGVADLDGDGAGEVLVGAFAAEPAELSPVANTGRAFLFSGKSGQFIRVLDSPSAKFGGTFGLPVAAIGDVTGDGSTDLAVTGLREDVPMGTADAGRVHLYDGKTGAYLRSLDSPDPGPASHFGYALASLPDLNGNGAAEVVVGELGQDFTSTGSRSGAVHIFDGATGSLIRTIQSPHPEGGGHFGFSVADTPDATGDGRRDIAVSAWREDAGAAKESGRVYLFDGVTFEEKLELVSPDPQLDGWFGIDVIGLGDIDGDGRSEIAVGAAYEDGGTGLVNSGRLYLFNGVTGSLIWRMRSPNEENGGEYGESLAALGDVTGDGWPDLVLGAHQESPGAAPDKAGRAYLVDGRRGALTRPRQEILAALLGIDPNPGRLDYNGDAALDIGDLIHDLIVHP